MSHVDFYFEFASPYAYFSSRQLPALCDRIGIRVDWKPILLGPIFRRTGARPLLTDGRRGEYAKRDCRRWALMHGIPYREPDRFPLYSLPAARGALVLEGHPQREAYVHAVFRAYWVDGRNVGEPEVLGEVAAGLGLDRHEFLTAIEQGEVKERLKQETEAAWTRGVFGAPTFFYRDEMLWGNDRLPMLERLIQEDRARPA